MSLVIFKVIYNYVRKIFTWKYLGKIINSFHNRLEQNIWVIYLLVLPNWSYFIRILGA